MKITIALSEDQNESLLIHEGETAAEAAHNFAQRFRLDTDTEILLKEQIEMNIKNLESNSFKQTSEHQTTHE